ncbi:MAG: ABC transporter permease subunit [Ruminococcaceae bacterium]|nr:ABC transporter permease subunit [Oscillospiraceae bacterium]
MKLFTTRSKTSTLLYIVISAVFWTALWALAAHLIGMELLLPSPLRTVTRLAELAVTAEFWRAAGMSLLRIGTGFLMGVLAGTLLAVPTALLRPADILFSPLNTVVRATPVASFIILALVWIERGRVPSFIAFLMVTPIVWSSLKTAIQNVDPQLTEMAQCYRLGVGKRITLLYLPAVMPQYAASMITSLGLAWKAGIAAEVLCRPDVAIGTDLYESKIYLETADLFAYTAAVILLSVVMELCFRALIGRLVRKEERA